jgi:hypothetical protein
MWPYVEVMQGKKGCGDDAVSLNVGNKFFALRSVI